MSALDPPCLHGKDVFHSKPRCRKNPDGTLVVEIDLALDVIVTFTFSRQDSPLVFCGVFCDYPLGEKGRVCRVRYGGEVHDVLVTVATNLAHDACAEFDREPPTERDPSKWGAS
jgi:hypothetical protein